MKYRLVAVAAVAFVGFAAGWFAWSQFSTNRKAANETVAGEFFTPPAGAGNHAGTEGPWARRILGAYSDDGLSWTKTNVVISDQADVPSLVVGGDGTLYMYYYGWTVGKKENVPAVALSKDDGKTWKFSYLSFSGFPDRGDVGDPEVAYDDGVFRMYGKSQERGNSRIVYGEGTDGIHFSYKGVAFQTAGKGVDVPTVFKTRDGWGMHVLGLDAEPDQKIGKHVLAASSGVTSFVKQDDAYFSAAGSIYFQGNVIVVPGGYRMYLFTDGKNGIRSWFSADRKTWTPEDGIRVPLDAEGGLEKGYVGDPDVVRLPDGRYFMAYATLIP